jgi:PEP-CTERM motif
MLYGQITVNSTMDYTDPFNILLDSAAITALNGVANTSAYFSIGGTLISSVPEPGSLVLLGTIAAGLVFGLRRHCFRESAPKYERTDTYHDENE